jgi:antitoxin HigA-1
MSEPQITPVRPGEVLLEDFLKPMGISQYRLARSIGVRCNGFTTSCTAGAP